MAVSLPSARATIIAREALATSIAAAPRADATASKKIAIDPPALRSRKWLWAMSQRKYGMP
jgi:hypothetical protein